MKIYDKLFHAYDIRGDNNYLTPEFTKKLANAVAHYFKKGNLVIGYDTRINSEKLSNILIHELIKYGFNIKNIGLSSTPYFYHSINEANADGGIIITASHLEKNMNGFKICGKKAEGISMNSGLELIKEYINRKSFNTKIKKGILEEVEYFASYKKLFGKKKYSFSIQIDCSNGSGSIEANILSDNFIKITIINSEADLENASHNPNPLEEEALRDIKKNAKNYDFSVIFDGDADRIIFLDDLGRNIPADIMGLILSRKYSRIIRDLTCSKLKFFKGKKIIESKVGRTNIALKMKEENADFGYEKSGHIFFKEFYYLDNPAIAIIKLAEILKEEKKSLRQIYNNIVKNYNEQYSVEKELDFKKILEQLKLFKKGKEKWLDGLSYIMKDSFVNIRKSNTEPIIRVTIEAKKKKIIKKIKEIIN